MTTMQPIEINGETIYAVSAGRRLPVERRIMSGGDELAAQRSSTGV
jgi:hypothetical protein